jgi:NMD protein affecting ribosome stability and mRNA decay
MTRSRRDRLIQERDHDPYRARGKLEEPNSCPDCGAVFRAGRWQWTAAGASAFAPGRPCPACQRIRDDYPAGYVTLRGEFLAEHREEILALSRNVEKREKTDHPLKRIMEMRQDGDAVVITTTDLHLARSIGAAVHRAYQGNLDYAYEKGETLLRVTWTR